MQTAVQKLEQQLKDVLGDMFIDFALEQEFEQAKEMEKQQIIDAANITKEDRWYRADKYANCGEKYYDKYYGSKGSNKEEQKKLITEIMNDDAKDGLYGSKGSDECKICEGNGYTVEIDLDCCGNCNEDGSCCNMPKQVQVQMPCICSKINGNNVEEVPNVAEISDDCIECDYCSKVVKKFMAIDVWMIIDDNKNVCYECQIKNHIGYGERKMVDKNEQKGILVELMELDAKDGLYNTPTQTEISDEEIRKYLVKLEISLTKCQYFEMGAKWYREQIKKKQ